MQRAGTRTVMPTETTTYRLIATGYGGTAIVQTTVTVEFPPVTVSIVASPSTIHPGETTTLSWNASGGTSGLMNQGIGLVEPAGTMVVEPAGSTEYVVTVAGAGACPGPPLWSLFSVTRNRSLKGPSGRVSRSDPAGCDRGSVRRKEILFGDGGSAGSQRSASCRRERFDACAP